MSAKSARAHSADEEPAKKRQKPNTSSSLLLESSIEVLRNVYSFLMLKDALALSRTCRQLRGNTNDVFQYSCIMDDEGLKKQGICEDGILSYSYLQMDILCNPISLDNLRSVLRNETLPQTFVKRFISYMISYSKTDHGEAISILLKDKRCGRDIENLEEALKKDFTNMGEALQNDKRIAKDMKVCGTCNEGIGIYYCGNLEDECQKWGQKYCRSCALKANRFCGYCNDYLCLSCIHDGNFCPCEECNRIVCAFDECAATIYECSICDSRSCNSCSLYHCPHCG